MIGRYLVAVCCVALVAWLAWPGDDAPPRAVEETSTAASDPVRGLHASAGAADSLARPGEATTAPAEAATRADVAGHAATPARTKPDPDWATRPTRVFPLQVFGSEDGRPIATFDVGVALDGLPTQWVRIEGSNQARPQVPKGVPAVLSLRATGFENWHLEVGAETRAVAQRVPLIPRKK